MDQLENAISARVVKKHVISALSSKFKHFPFHPVRAINNSENVSPLGYKTLESIQLKRAGGDGRGWRTIVPIIGTVFVSFTHWLSERKRVRIKICIEAAVSDAVHV